jgi:hypothetical protein
MAEITSSRVASVGDPDAGVPDSPAPRPRSHAGPKDKPASAEVAQIAELEEDHHTLDETA